MDEGDQYKLMVGHTIMLTDEVNELRRARDDLHDLIYVLTKEGFYTTPVTQEIIEGRLKEIRSGKF